MDRKRIRFGLFGACNCNNEEDHEFECPDIDLPPEALECEFADVFGDEDLSGSSLLLRKDNKDRLRGGRQQKREGEVLEEGDQVQDQTLTVPENLDTKIENQNDNQIQSQKQLGTVESKNNSLSSGLISSASKSESESKQSESVDQQAAHQTQTVTTKPLSEPPSAASTLTATAAPAPTQKLKYGLKPSQTRYNQPKTQSQTVQDELKALDQIIGDIAREGGYSSGYGGVDGFSSMIGIGGVGMGMSMGTGSLGKGKTNDTSKGIVSTGACSIQKKEETKSQSIETSSNFDKVKPEQDEFVVKVDEPKSQIQSVTKKDEISESSQVAQSSQQTVTQSTQQNSSASDSMDNESVTVTPMPQLMKNQDPDPELIKTETTSPPENTPSKTVNTLSSAQRLNLTNSPLTLTKVQDINSSSQSLNQNQRSSSATESSSIAMQMQLLSPPSNTSISSNGITSSTVIQDQSATLMNQFLDDQLSSGDEYEPGFEIGVQKTSTKKLVGSNKLPMIISSNSHGTVSGNGIQGSIPVLGQSQSLSNVTGGNINTNSTAMSTGTTEKRSTLPTMSIQQQSPISNSSDNHTSNVVSPNILQNTMSLGSGLDKIMSMSGDTNGISSSPLNSIPNVTHPPSLHETSLSIQSQSNQKQSNSTSQSLQTGPFKSPPLSGKIFIRQSNYFHHPDNPMVLEYIDRCRKYNLQIDPGVVACLQTQGHAIYTTCEGLLPIASILCHPNNPSITRLHLLPRWDSQQRRNQFVCLVLEQILLANKTLEYLDLRDIGINHSGAAFLKNGLSRHSSLKQLNLSRNDLGSRGCKQIIRAVATMPKLEFIDISYSSVGAYYVRVMEELCEKHPRKPIVVFQGNTESEEIWGAITHGLGWIWAIVASIYLLIYIRQSPVHHIIGCWIYSVCLVMLFTFSTLYHSLFLKERTHKVLQILDHIGIFCFIASCYTPIVLLSSKMGYSWKWIFLSLQWGLAIFGCVSFILAFYFQTFKQMYSAVQPLVCLAMGWSIMIKFDDLVVPMPEITKNLMVLGGLLYTVGVVFLLNDQKRPFFHIIWHLFVLIAAICQWFGIFSYIEPARLEYEAMYPELYQQQVQQQGGQSLSQSQVQLSTSSTPQPIIITGTGPLSTLSLSGVTVNVGSLIQALIANVTTSSSNNNNQHQIPNKDNVFNVEDIEQKILENIPKQFDLLKDSVGYLLGKKNHMKTGETESDSTVRKGDYEVKVESDSRGEL